MMKRISAMAVCVLLLFAAGCSQIAASPAATSPSAHSASPTGAGALTPTPAAQSSSTDTSATSSPSPSPSASAASQSASASASPTKTAGNPTEGMKFPDSDTKLIKWADLVKLSADDLGLARNEIYARAGKQFTTSKYADYYGKLSWYKADPSFSDTKFSEIQWANIHLIQVLEAELDGQLLSIASGTKLDYDQDGSLETLTFSVPDDTHMSVKIKNGSTTLSWDITCDNPINKVYIGDIDFKDGMLDLFIGESGPSDDYSVYVAGVKKDAFFVRTGTSNMPGAINSGKSTDPFKLDGKGNITTLRRMDVISTDFFIVKYNLNSSGKIAFVPQSSYSFLKLSADEYTVTTKMAIPLKASASSGAATAVTVPAGTKVQLISTDGSKWIKVKTASGEYWLEMASVGFLANPHVSSADAFTGLVIAD